MRAWIIAICAALVLHGLVLLFGGIFFMKPAETGTSVVENVDLLATAQEEPQEQPEELREQEVPPELEVEQPAPPLEMHEVVDTPPQIAPTDLVGRLEALSLGALESALDPGGGAEGFGGTASLASGGQIGGTGMPGSGVGSGESSADTIFDIGALDQLPRVVHQAAPIYPPDLRRRKIEGTVYVVFVVDQEGRVHDPAIETAPDEAFHAAALAAVKRWRFEPALVRGEKVRSKMRVPIRFSLNG